MSTVQGGVVRPFPASCMEDCVCKDPNASENRRQNDHQEEQRLVLVWCERCGPYIGPKFHNGSNGSLLTSPGSTG